MIFFSSTKGDNWVIIETTYSNKNSINHKHNLHKVNCHNLNIGFVIKCGVQRPTKPRECV
jgi:hypothetical protein